MASDPCPPCDEEEEDDDGAPEVVYTRCWRAGCTLLMRNGYDHKGTCNMVVDSPRRKAPVRSSVALLDYLDADVLSHLCGMHLQPSQLLVLEQCCGRLQDLLRGETGRLAWHEQLGRVLELEPGWEDGGSACCRSLYRAFSGPLEVQGWADATAVEAGDMHAWWRCRAVGLRGGGAAAVRVRYDGYRDTEDEWRVPTDLRRQVEPKRSEGGRGGFHGRRRRLHESVEVSWAVPGHPAALWEAKVIDAGAARGSLSDRICVRYAGHSDDAPDDEWLPGNSRRIRPPRGGPEHRLVAGDGAALAALLENGRGGRNYNFTVWSSGGGGSWAVPCA